MPTETPHTEQPPEPARDPSNLRSTITRLQTQLARQKRRLEKTIRNESQLESLLLTSERDIESLRDKLHLQQQQAQEHHREKDSLLKHAHQQLTECHQQLDKYQSTLKHAAEQGNIDCKRFQSVFEEKDHIYHQTTKQLQQCLDQREHAFNQLFRDVTNLSQRSDQLHQRCQQQKERQHHLEQQRDSFRDDAQRLQAQLNKLNHQSDRLRKQLSRMPDPDAHRQLQSQLEQLRQQVTTVKQQLQESRQQATVFKQQCSLHEDTIVETKSQLHTVKQQLSEAHQRLQSQSSQFDARLDQARIANEQLEANLQQLQQQLQKRPTEEQVHDLKSAVAEKDHIISQKDSLLQAANHQASEAEQRAAARGSEFESHLQDARNARDGLEKCIEQFQRQLAQRPTEEQYQSLQSTVAEKEQIISQKDALLQAANQDQQRSAARASELESHLQEARAVNDNLKTNVQQLENQLQQRPTEEQYRSMQSAAVKKDEIISQKDALLQAANEHLSEDQQRAAARVSELESQLNEARTAHNELQSNLEQVQQLLEKRPTEEQYQQLQSMIAEKEQIISEKHKLLQTTNQQLSESQQLLASQASEFQAEMKSVRNANAELEASLRTVQDELAKRPTEESYQKLQSDLKEQEALISQKETLLQSSSRQLSESAERTDALKSEFDSRLNDAQAANDELKAKLEESESKLDARPTTQELQELKNDLKQNASLISRLQEEKSSLRNGLEQLEETCKKQRVEIQEKTNLLLDAKNQLVECSEHINASETRLQEEISRFSAMFEEKDDVIAEMETQISNYKQEATTSAQSFEQERQRLMESLEDNRKKASEELAKVGDSHQALVAEHEDLQKRFHELSHERDLLKKQIEISDNTLSSKQSVLESLRTEEQGLSQKVNALVKENSSLQKMLQKSDKLVAEARKTSEQVVHIQATEYKKEISALQAQISASRSQADVSVEFLRRIVKRLNHLLTLSHERQNTCIAEITEGTSTNQLQAAANVAVVAIEEDLRSGIHIQSEMKGLEEREKTLNSRIKSLEDENHGLTKAVQETEAELVQQSKHIQALNSEHSELKEIVTSYQRVVEESGKRLQYHEEAAENAFAAVSAELRRQEQEYEKLQAAKTNADGEVQELSKRLADKANVEAQLDEIQRAHAETTDKASVQIKQLESEKEELEAKLKGLSAAVSHAKEALRETKQSLQNVTNERDHLENERTVLVSERHRLEETNKEMAAEYEKIKAEVESLSVALKEKTTIEVQYSTANATQEQELCAMNSKLTKVVEAKSRLEQELADSSNNLKHAREALHVSEEKVRSMDQKCSVLTSERDNAAGDILNLRESLRSASEQKASLQASISELEKELETLRASDKSHTEANASLRKDVTSKQRELDESFSKQSELAKRVESLEADIKDSASLFEEQKDNLVARLDQERKSEVAKLQDDFKVRFREAAERAEETMINLRNEVSSLEAKLRDHSIELETKGNVFRGQLEQKESDLVEAQKKLQAAIEAHEHSQGRRNELESELKKNRCVLKEYQDRVEGLVGIQREKEAEIERFTEKYERATTAIHTLESRVSDSEATNTQVESELRKELLDLSGQLQGIKTDRAELERCLRDKEELSVKRLAEIERLTSTVVPRLKEEAEAQQQESERLAGILDAKNEEWKTLNSTLSEENRTISRQLGDAKHKLRLGEEILLRKETDIEELKKEVSEKDNELEAHEAMQPRRDEMLRKANENVERLQREVDLHRERKEEDNRRSREKVERLHQEIDVHRQRMANLEREIGNKEVEQANVEAQFQKSNEKCLNLEKEIERLSSSMSDLKERSEEVTVLQREHGKLTRKVKNLQRKARRAEMLLQHEKKNHAAMTKQFELEAKRQVSPSTKGLSPAMKRARAQSLRPPLSPRDGNLRPPLMPKLHTARRSLDFG